jgi:hypothetical protein
VRDKSTLIGPAISRLVIAAVGALIFVRQLPALRQLARPIYIKHGILTSKHQYIKNFDI